jgi:endonuclease/exonuclease/phosphatase family metal-dependent hydrolase
MVQDRRNQAQEVEFGRLLRRFFVIVVCLVWLLSSSLTASQRAELIRVMTYNIHHGEGMDGRLDVPRIAAVILGQKADLVALQEVDRSTARTGNRDLPAELAALTGLNYVFGKNIDFQGGEYGNLILSRFPIEQHQNLHFKRHGDGEQRGLLQAVVTIAGRRLVFMSTHLDHRPDDQERLTSIEQIAEAASKYGRLPMVIAGDFNDHPGSRTHLAMKEQGFRDVWEIAGDGNGFTFPAERPRSRIDYVWLSNKEELTPVEAWVVPTEASDHIPLVVDCRLSVPDFPWIPLHDEESLLGYCLIALGSLVGIGMAGTSIIH